MGRRRHPRAAGFTLLETMLAAAIGSAVLLAAYACFDEDLRTAASGMRLQRLQARAREEVEAIASALQETDAGFFGAAVLGGQGVSAIDWKEPAGVASGQIVWGPPCRIRWVLAPGGVSNGEDDDGDGLADEGAVEWIRDFGRAGEQTVRTVRDVGSYAARETGNGLDDNGNGLVDERGLSFVWNGMGLLVRLTIEGRDDRGRLLRASVETIARPRNAS